MEPLFPGSKRALLYVGLLQFSISVTFAQTPSSARCQVSTSPVSVRAEGLTERLGDIVLQCSGSNPGTVFSGNFTLFLPVSITNRVDSGNLTRDAVLSVDLGSGFVPTAIAGQVSSNSISFNGISYTTPPSGNVGLRISNVRAAMNQLGYTSAVPAQVTGSLSTSLAVDQSQVILAYSQAGMFASMSEAGISCYGSPSPDTFDLPSLFAAGTAFSSTRVTEGFASAFEAKSAGTDTGTRFLVKYSGFPSTTRLFIPDAVAGSGRAPTHLGRRPELAAGGRTVHARQWSAGAGSRAERRCHRRRRASRRAAARLRPGDTKFGQRSRSHQRLGLRGLRSRGRQPQCAGVGAVPHVRRSAALDASGRRPGDHRPGPGLVRDYGFGHRAHPAVRRRPSAERLQTAGRLQGSGCPAAQTSAGSHAHPHQCGRRRGRDDQPRGHFQGSQYRFRQHGLEHLGHLSGGHTAGWSSIECLEPTKPL